MPTIPQVTSPLRMEALLNVTRQLSKLDANRLITNIHHVATGDARAPSAWMSLFYDLQELEDVFHKLSRAGHDIRAAYRDFDDLRRWVQAAASTMSHSTPLSPRDVPAKSALQRSPVTTSIRPQHTLPRASPTIPPSPQQFHRSSKGRVTAPAPVRTSPAPKARFHVRFAPTATVYTIPCYTHETPSPAERSSRAPRQSHAKYVIFTRASGCHHC